MSSPNKSFHHEEEKAHEDLQGADLDRKISAEDLPLERFVPFVDVVVKAL
jgi:hypothetical protein